MCLAPLASTFSSSLFLPQAEPRNISFWSYDARAKTLSVGVWKGKEGSQGSTEEEDRGVGGMREEQKCCQKAACFFSFLLEIQLASSFRSGTE